MHTTTTSRRGRTARGLLAVALATAATAGAALGASDARAAQAVPDWIADFAAASDAFEGGGGGGGGGGVFVRRNLGCGWYYAYVEGRYTKVYWCDYTTPPGVPGPVRECGIEDGTSGTSRPIRCP
jgi:hypothetical protein